MSAVFNIVKATGLPAEPLAHAIYFIKSGSEVRIKGYVTDANATAFPLGVLDENDILSTLLTGFTAGTNATIVATDSIFDAFRKAQGQLNNLATAVSNNIKVPNPIDCSANPNYPSALAGDSYIVTVAGRIGGASGIIVEVGDKIIARQDNAGGTQAAVGSAWFILQANIGNATTTTTGVTRISTSAEATAGSEGFAYITPSTLRVGALATPLTGYAVGTNTALGATDSILGAFGKVQGQINNKFNSPTGTTSQYLRGDGSLATLNTTAVTEGTNLYFSEARVRASLLTGYAVGTNTALGATDSILGAFGKIQGQINNKFNSPAGTTSQYLRGDGSLATLNTTAVTEGTNLYFSEARVRASLLTGYAVGTNTALSATDSILGAFGKIQGQINNKQNALTNPITGTIASGQVAFGTGAGVIGGDSGFTFVSNRLDVPEILSNYFISRIASSYESSSANPNIYGSISAIGLGQGSGDLILSSRANLPRSIHFVTNNGTDTDSRWLINSNGILRSNGAQTIQTSTGNLTLATGGGNGNILLSPDGTGSIGIGTSTLTGINNLYIFKQNGGNGTVNVKIENSGLISGGGVITNLFIKGDSVGTGFTETIVTNIYGEVRKDTDILLDMYGSRGVDNVLKLLGSGNLFLKGNVLIGTTTDLTGLGRLQVNGNLNIATVANATGDFLTHVNGIVNKRTAAQVRTEIVTWTETAW
jgi:hypothetical protein